MTVYLSLVTHKKYRYDRPDFFKWAGGRKLRFCNHDFSDYRAKKNSARSGCQLQRQSHPHRRRNGGKSRNSLFFNAHTFTHIYYLSPRAGLDSKRLFLTILRAGPDYSTEGAKPDPRIHQHHPADTCRPNEVRRSSPLLCRCSSQSPRRLFTLHKRGKPANKKQGGLTVIYQRQRKPAARSLYHSCIFTFFGFQFQFEGRRVEFHCKHVTFDFRPHVAASLTLEGK